MKSVLKQAYQFFEIVVVDDASTDNSAQIVKDLEDKRIRIIKHLKNKGLSATRNTGIEAAKHDYVAFLDADDNWHDNFLENIMRLIDKFPEQRVFATHYSENFNGTLFVPKTKLPTSKKGSYMLIDNFFKVNLGRLILTQSCIALHKDVFAKVGKYNEEVTFAEDIDFFSRCFSVFNLAYYYKECHTQNTTVENSLTQSFTMNKKYPDLKKHLGQTKELDKFIYFYMYCFCQRIKTENRMADMYEIRKDIRLDYLNIAQIILLYMPKPFYSLLFAIKSYFLKRGLQLTSF